MRLFPKPFSLFSATILLAALSSCQKEPSEGILSQGEMEDFVYDYQMALAARQDGSTSSATVNYTEAILRKYDLTQKEFDRTLEWYARHPKEFSKVYEQVEKRLKEEAETPNASSASVPVADTTTKPTNSPTSVPPQKKENLWQGAPHYLLSIQGKHYFTFRQKAVGSSPNGEQYTLRFSTQWLYREGLKSGIAALCVKYDNDSTATSTMNFSSSGEQTVILSTTARKVKEIYGFIYQNDTDKNGVKLLYVHNIILERIPMAPVETTISEEQRRADSITRRKEREQKIQDSLLRQDKRPGSHFL